MREIREENRIGKFHPAGVITEVIRSLGRKPILLLPFLVPVLVTIADMAGDWIIINLLHDIELPKILTWFSDLLYRGDNDYLGLYYTWNALTLIVSFFTGIIVSAWAIQSYWSYFRLGDFSLSASLKKGLGFFPKLLGARLLVVLILLIPGNLVQLVMYVMMIRMLGSVDEYLRYMRACGIPISIYMIAVSAFFVFIFQAVMIEKKGVIGSLKGSFKVAGKNYGRVVAIMSIPLLAAIPFILVGIMAWDGIGSGNHLYNTLSYWIPSILGLLLAPVVFYSLTHAYILSVKGRRRGYRVKFGR